MKDGQMFGLSFRDMDRVARFALEFLPEHIVYRDTMLCVEFDHAVAKACGTVH